MMLSKLSVNLLQHKKTSKRETSPIHKASPSLIPNGSPAGSCAGQGLSSLSQSLSYTAAPTATRVPGAKERRRPLSPAAELPSYGFGSHLQPQQRLDGKTPGLGTSTCSRAAGTQHRQLQSCSHPGLPWHQPLQGNHGHSPSRKVLEGRSFLLEPSYVSICHSEARNHLKCL